MKILTMFGGKEFLLEEDEANNIIIGIGESSKGKTFLALRCGAFINTSAIESITDIPLIPFFGGDRERQSHYLSKDSNGNYFYQYEGKRINIEIDKVEFLEDPKYKELAEVQFKKLKSGKV